MEPVNSDKEVFDEIYLGRRHRRQSSLILFSILILIIATVLWAWFTKVDQVTRVSGEVSPSEKIRILQAAEQSVVKDIYVDDRNVKATFFGIGMLYQRYLLPKESRSNFYLQGNVDISTFKLSHDIDLTKETYTLNNLQVTCSACGILTIQTDPDKVHIIPTISLGYQYKIKPNFKTNLSLGMQYIDPGSLENFTNTKYLSLIHI